MKKLAVCSLALAVLLIVMLTAVYAVPANPTPFTVHQPDGTPIEVRQIGDERGAHIETMAGYTVIQDNTGHWVYAELQNNQLSSSYILADTYASPSLPKHVQPTKSNYISASNLGASNLDPKSNSICGFGCKQLSSSISSPSRAPQTGNRTILVFLINFTDTSQDAAHTPDYYRNLLFNTSNPNSFWAYYNESSYGKVNFTGIIVGNKWYQSTHNMSFYGGNGNSCGGSSIDSGESGTKVCIFNLTIEAMTLADGDINYSEYDTDGDGILEDDEIDILVIHAGGVEENGGGDNSIWSHKWIMYGSGYSDGGTNFVDVYLDGTRITLNTSDTTNVGSYAMVGEGSPVGTIAHEFGHMLGLPDLYNTASGASAVGDWDIMDDGSWNGNPAGSSPAHPCAWSKYFLGWVEPILATNNLLNTTIAEMPIVERNNTIYMLINSTYNGTGYVPDNNGTEYFLVENRQKVGFDSGLPGNGLLIWHIDDSVGSISSNGINNNNSHKRVDLESADNTDPSTNYGDSGDPWKGGEEFNSTSTPNSSFYNGTASNARVIIRNSAPNATNVTVTPTSATTVNNLTCNYTFFDYDDDSENGSIIKWYVNGVENTTFENLTTILSGNTTKNQNWSCSVTPSDGTDSGSQVNSSILTIQNAAPSAIITYPTGGEELNGTITITANVTDADGQSDIQNVWFYYSNNSVNWTLIGNQTNHVGSEYNISWNTSNVTDGFNIYKIRVNASDGSSNATNTTSNFSVNNINEAPSITLTNPTGGETWSGTKTITWTATDPDNDTLTIDIQISDDSGSSWSNVSTNETNDGSYSGFDTTDYSDGNDYRIKVIARDPDGLTDSDSSGDFEIDNVQSNTSSSTSSAGLDNGLTTSWITKAFSLITAGSKATWALPASSGLALTYVEVSVKTTLSDVTLKAKKLDSKPSSISVIPGGKIYQYFEMSTSNMPSTSISSVLFKFKVPKSWFTSNNADEDAVSLRRWSGNGWTKLETTKYSSDSTYNYYSAPSSGFSYFVITASEKSQTVANTEEIGGKEQTTGNFLKDFEKVNPYDALQAFLAGQTFGLDNTHWFLIFISVVFMFVFLVIMVRAQQQLKPRPRRTSRWKMHRPPRPPYYGWGYSGKTQQIKPTAYFSPLRRGRLR